MVLTLGTLSAGAQPSPSERPARPAWSPAVGEALDLYRAGRYTEARALCVRLAQAGDGEPWRQEVALVEALCLLRMPARQDRFDGRARLRELAAEDPDVFRHPEVQLAYGVAQTALAETADALDALDHAVRGFAEPKQPAREAEALVALAETWAVHGEWEMTPPRLSLKQPSDAEGALALRLEQIAAARARAAALPEQPAAVDAIDLTRARLMLTRESTAAEGRRVLEKLAADGQLSAPRAAALMELATLAEAEERWAVAQRLYQRLEHEWSGDLARRAADRGQILRQPQVELEVPRSVRVGAAITPRLRARGVTELQVEVRRVALEPWLGNLRERGNPGTLPETGSVRFAADLDVTIPADMGWWDTDQLATPIAVTAEAGAYVVIAQGRMTDGQTVKEKRLVVVTDLAAWGLMGPRHALLWVTSASGESRSELEATPTAQFWMKHSFVPLQPEFNGPLAHFALPNEATVMRSRSWICLIRCGEQIVLCSGVLPPRATTEAAAVALFAGPPLVRPGETLTAGGVFLPDALGHLPDATAEPLTLVVRDALQEQLGVFESPVIAGGGFAAEMRIDPSFEGRHLRFVPQAGGQVLPALGAATGAYVPRFGTQPLFVHLETPAQVSGPRVHADAVVTAHYPWGEPAEGADVQWSLRAVRLPEGPRFDEMMYGPPHTLNAKLDTGGQARMGFHGTRLGFESGAVAVAANARVRALDGSEGATEKHTLIGATPPYAWIATRPVAPLAGDEVRFEVGWFAPEGLATWGNPVVQVRQVERVVAVLNTHVDGMGLLSAAWRAGDSGTHEVSIEVPVHAGPPLRIARNVEIAAGPAESGAELACCRAQFAGDREQRAVDVAVSGKTRAPLLVVLEHGDPLGAALLSPPHMEQGARLTSLDPKVVAARVRLFSTAGGVLRPLCVVDVQPAAADALELELKPPVQTANPSSTVRVCVRCALPPSQPAATLLARLVDAEGVANARRLATEGEPPRRGLLRVASSLGGDEDVESEIPLEETRAGGDELLRAAVQHGRTHWTTVREVETGEHELEVPLPRAPGIYHLLVALRGPTNAVSLRTSTIDTRGGLRLALDLPPVWSVGDRAMGVLRIDNQGADPLEGRLAVNLGPGLAADSVRLGGEAARAMTDEVSVTVPAGAHTWVWIDTEARAAAAGTAQVTLRTAGGEVTAEANYAVRSVEPSAAGASAVQIERRVEIWHRSEIEEHEHYDEHAAHHSHGPPGEWLPWTPGQPLEVGDYLRVRETLNLENPWTDVVWTQRIPSVFQPILGNTQRGDWIGVRQPGAGAEVEFRASWLAPRTHTHQYHLNVVRRGVAELPAPRLQAGGAKVPSSVPGFESRFVVRPR